MTPREPTTETVLYEGPCRSMRGPLATVGRVEVRVGAIAFEPSRLDRIAGARSFVLAPNELTRIILRDDHLLELTAGDVSHTLEGKDVADLEHAIRRALVLDPKARAKRPTLAPSERVVLVVPARVTSERGLRCGTLTVTSTRLYFAHAGIDKIEGGPVGFDVQLDQVRDVHFDAKRGAHVTLVVDQGELSVYEVVTPRSAAVFAVLCGLDERTALHQGGFRTHEATLVVGQERVRGLFAFTRHILRFEAQGETRVPLELPLAELSRVERDGSRLVIRHALQRYGFEVEDGDRAFDELVRLLADLRPRGEPRADDVGCYEQPTIERLVAAHGLQILGFTPGRFALGGPAVVVTAKEGARRGALLLADLGAVFLPFGDGTEPRLIARIESLTARPPEDDPTHGGFDQRGSGASLGESFEVFPFGGSGFLERFRLRLKRLAEASRDSSADWGDYAQSQDAVAPTGLNRRSSYRVRPRESVRTSISPVSSGLGGASEDAAQEARLTDLSADGCHLVSDRPVLAATVEVAIHGSVPPTNMLADVVYETRPSSLSPLFNYGLRFVKRNPEQERRLRELWMEYQRRELELYRGK